MLGLLFAATVASVTHSLAMPMMDSTMHGMELGSTGPEAGDHDCAAAAGDEQPDLPSGPCEQGCLLCKSCSLASVLLGAPPSLVTPSRYHEYQSTAFLPLTSVIPALPSEPPRA